MKKICCLLLVAVCLSVCVASAVAEPASPQVMNAATPYCVDVYFSEYGSLMFDITNYVQGSPDCFGFEKDTRLETTAQFAAGFTNVPFSLDLEPNVLYRYSIWYSYAEDLFPSIDYLSDMIPDIPWITFYVTEQREIVIVSTDIPVLVKNN